MKYSVIVAFKDEIGYIEKMLETLINQSLSPQEVILVNDSSSDGSEKLFSENSTGLIASPFLKEKPSSETSAPHAKL